MPMLIDDAYCNADAIVNSTSIYDTHANAD